jgi:hypothetical protein
MLKFFAESMTAADSQRRCDEIAQAIPAKMTPAKWREAQARTFISILNVANGASPHHCIDDVIGLWRRVANRDEPAESEWAAARSQVETAFADLIFVFGSLGLAGPKWYSTEIACHALRAALWSTEFAAQGAADEPWAAQNVAWSAGAAGWAVYCGPLAVRRSPARLSLDAESDYARAAVVDRIADELVGILNSLH